MLHVLDLCSGYLLKTELIVLLVYRTLNGLAPQHIKDLWIVNKPARPLRSTGRGLLTSPRTNAEVEDAAFCTYAPSSKPLPEDLREPPTHT